jgi:hypothetical protein
MSEMITLEIPRSEWEKFKEELIRMVTIMQEHKRESDERWERMAAYDDRHQQMMAEIDRRLANVDRYLGDAEIAHQLR